MPVSRHSVTYALVAEDGEHVALGADLVLEHLLVDTEVRVAVRIVVGAAIVFVVRGSLSMELGDDA